MSAHHPLHSLLNSPFYPYPTRSLNHHQPRRLLVFPVHIASVWVRWWQNLCAFASQPPSDSMSVSQHPSFGSSQSFAPLSFAISANSHTEWPCDGNPIRSTRSSGHSGLQFLDADRFECPPQR